MGGKAIEETAGLLDGLRVVELGGRLAAPLTTMMLADHGAEVVRVPIPGVDGDPMLRALLGRGKSELADVQSGDLRHSEERSRIRALLSHADVAVTELRPSDLAALGVDFEELRASVNPGLVSCTIPLFPAGDPRADLPPLDSVAGAAACLYERMLGAPRFHDFPVPSVLASLFAASGIMAALYSRIGTGRGQAVESTLFGSSLFAQILVVFMKTGVPRGFVPLKLVATPFMRAWRCSDGRYAYLHITLPAHNARMIEMLDQMGLGTLAAELRSVLSPQTVRDPSQVGSIGEARKIIRVLEKAFLQRTADQWEETLGRDLCCIKVRTAQEWLVDSMAAGMVDAIRVDDPVFGPLTAPGPGVLCGESPRTIPPRRTGTTAESVLQRWGVGRGAHSVPIAAPQHLPGSIPGNAPGGASANTSGCMHGVAAPPLAGVRVADLSRIIAGPCAARLLAELGAEVTSVQSPGGLDWALSFHLLFNPGKRSVAVDMTGQKGRDTLHKLLAEIGPDVLIHNYRHLDVARSMGLGPETLQTAHPGIVYTHLNAYGNQGVWQERPGFEQVVQAVSGIQMSYGAGGKPKLLPTPVIDIGSGLAGAFAALCGLYHRRRTGHGTFVTTHLTWISVVFQILELAKLQRPAGIEGEDTVAGLVRVRGGHALIAGPAQDVAAWLRSAGAPLPPATPPRSCLAHVGRSLALRSVAHWQRTIRNAGLEGRIVLVSNQTARKLLADHPGLAAGALPLLSRRPYPGCPIPLAFQSSPLRLEGTPTVLVSPPPLRGADTRDALARIGADVPEGTGVVPYPEDKPYLVWLVTLIRWGLFAWRSGSV